MAKCAGIYIQPSHLDHLKVYASWWRLTSLAEDRLQEGGSITFARHGQPGIRLARPGVLRRHAPLIVVQRVAGDRSGEKLGSPGPGPSERGNPARPSLYVLPGQLLRGHFGAVAGDPYRDQIPGGGHHPADDPGDVGAAEGVHERDLEVGLGDEQQLVADSDEMGDDRDTPPTSVDATRGVERGHDV
jgi:hypothetical protein